MPADPNRVREVFLAAVELPLDQRPAYLAEACGGDAELRAEVDRLLAANADPDSILEPACTHAGGRHRLRPRQSRDRPTPGRNVRHCRVRPGHADPTAMATETSGPDRVRPRRLPTRSRCRHGGGIRRSPPPARQGPDRRRDRHRHRRPVHAGRGDRRGRHGLGLSGQPDRTGQAAGRAQADQDRHGLAGRAGPVRRRAAGPGADGPPEHRPHLRRRRHPGRPAVLRHGAGAAACRSPSTATGSG